MADETPPGPAGAAHRRGHSQGSPGEQSPLQARAQFLKNRSWLSIISFNRGACERGGAQHGFNKETYQAVAEAWEKKRLAELSFLELLDFLRQCHKRAPFLFFNGNTFADTARQITVALFGDLPSTRKTQLASAVAHFVAGVLGREEMFQIVESLTRIATYQPGDRVKTFRGSSRGVIVRLLEDGRVLWRPDGSGAELIALPESLLKED